MAGRAARSGAVSPIIGALLKAVRRDLKTVGSFSGNNLFVVGVVFVFLKDPGMFEALGAFIALVLFIPLSADPLRVVPRDRLALWPLSEGERRWLRMVTPWLNPVMWLVVALALWKRISTGLFAATAGVFAIGFVLPSLRPVHKGVWRHLPGFPGLLNQLLRKNLREMLSTLDFWCSALISAFALGFRAAGLLPDASLLPLTIIVLLAISTYAQTLFGLDGEGGMMRYRLMPVRGWQVIAAKDAPFLVLAILVTLPLAPVAGIAGAIAALAMGHHASVMYPGNQVRWRFLSGVSFGASVVQVVVMAGAAAAVHTMLWLMPVCLAAYAGSIWWYGKNLERG